MSEAVPNRTRSALILLLITVIVIIAILFVNIIGWIDIQRQTPDEDYEDGLELGRSGSMCLTCMFIYISSLVIFVLYIIGISFMFSARKAYGEKHGNKAVGAFVLALAIPVLSIAGNYIFSLFTVNQNGITYMITIVLFSISLLLVTFDLEGKWFSALACGIVILSSFPLLFITKISYDDSKHNMHEIPIIMIMSSIGLIIGMMIFILAIKKGLDFTKANPPRQDNLHLRLLNQQAQQLRMEVDILRMQREQMEVLSDIKAERIEGANAGLLGHRGSVEFSVDKGQFGMGEHLREYDPSENY